MKIGDPILRRLTETVSIIEKQFNAVEMIDNYNLGEKDPFELLKAISKILRSISDCDLAQIYMKINSVHKRYFIYPIQANSEEIIIDEKLKKNVKSLKVINQIKEQRSLLILLIDTMYIPECYIILQESYFGRKNSKIYDKEFQSYLEYISKKIVEKIEHYSKSKMLLNHNKLSKRFLMSRENSDIDNLNENVWTNILNSTFDYLPIWGPLSLGSKKPRMQILIVQKGRHFLNLVADSVEEEGNLKIISKNLNLDKERTICGIYLDNEDKGNNDEYLLVNPKDHMHRYASILFGRDEIPESELIIPIKDSNGKTIVLFNFEHISKNVFSKYHIKTLIQMVEDVEPFVKYAIYKNEQQIDFEKRLRYLMLKILTKITDTQQHKLKNDFGNLKSAIREIELEVEKGTKVFILEEIQKAKRFVQGIMETSIDFTVNLQDYVHFGKKSISDILNKSLPDANKKANLSGDNIKVNIGHVPKEKYVFCSGLAQEHIYNIIQNAIDQFISIRKKNDQYFVGEIQIEYSEKKLNDEEANIYTFNLIEISISDNGGGVPEDKEQWIFGFNNSLKKDDGGNGFGLFSAKEYMKEIGGDLVLKNDFPRGATFIMQFPEYRDALHDALAEQFNIKGGI